MSLMRDRAGRAPVAARQGQAVGRHERRPRLVEAGGPRTPMARVDSTVRPARVDTPVRAARASGAAGPRATRARSRRHAGSAGWAGRARRLAGQARAWWTEGAERVAALAHERWADQASGAMRTPTPTPTGGRLSGGPGWGRVQGTQTAGRGRQALGGGRGQRALASVDGGRDQPGAGPGPRHLAAARRRGEDLVTGWCSLLLVLGLYLDGWNHNGLQGDASRPFLTPWHALLYAGLVATAAWILTQGQRRGAWSLRAVPAGYRLGLTGIGLAIVAVATDAVWHLRHGEEQGPAGLVAPYHLVLFAGAGLLVTAALRAAWSGPSSARVPGLRAFWPVLWSTTLVVATTAFFFQQVSPVVTWRQPALAGPALAGTMQLYGLLGLLVHNLLFIAPVLLLLLRWQTPLGTFTVMAGSVSLLLATQTELGLLGLAGAAVVGGAAADVAVSLLRPSPQRRWAARAVAVIAPAVYWTAHFALLRAGYGVGWDVQVLLGSVVWASLSGLTLALLMWPPAVPLTAWNRGRSAAARSTARSAATPTPMPARMVGR
jgi:hypothetical protein